MPTADSRTVPRPVTQLRAFLNVLVHRLGEVVETSDAGDVRRVGGAHFRVGRPGAQVSDPYPDLPSLFAAEGSTLHRGHGGRILEWCGWVLSEDRHGHVAGPYHGFDEWAWSEGETVWRASPAPGTGGRPGARFIHAWGGLHFVTVDPFPTSPVAFPTLRAALRALPAHPLLDVRLRAG